MSDKSEVRPATDDLQVRIEGAIQRLRLGMATMRIPVDRTDVDIVLFDCGARVGSDRAVIAELLSALKRAEQKFTDYAAIHWAKDTQLGRNKALENEVEASACRAAIQKAEAR